MALSEKGVKRALNDSIKDGSAHSAMTGITSTYSTPFALAMGASNAEVGFLNSIPNLFSTLLQPFIGKYLKSIGIKNSCVSLGLMHRLLLIPIIFIPIFFVNEGIFFLILLMSLFNTFYSFSNTSWSSLMGKIVPEKIRGRYFGRRNMYQGAFSFLSILLGGWILGVTGSLRGFSFIFFLALVFGFISYFYLSRIPTVREALPIKSNPVNERKYRYFKPFTRYMALTNFAVNLSSPFFTVYMLSVMNIGYEWYGIVIAIEILTKIIMHEYWGSLADKFGDRNIMSICGIMTVFYPFIFIFVRSGFDLIIAGIFAGMAWSGFDLAAFNYLLDSTPPEKRSSYISSYKLYTGMALFLGPFVGGLLSDYFTNIRFFWLEGLQILFLVSFLFRGAVAVYGLPQIGEIRCRRNLPAADVFMKAFAIYPLRGINHEMVYLNHHFGKLENNIFRRLRQRL